MKGFEEIDNKPKQNKDKPKYKWLNIADGDEVSGLFAGEPHKFYVHWINGRTQPCKGHTCETCASGEKNTFKFRINFILFDKDIEGKVSNVEARVLEKGWRFYEQIGQLNKKFPLERTIVDIHRMGSDKNTTYLITPDADKTALTDEQIERLMSQVELYDFNFKPKEIKPKPPSNPVLDDDDDLPF